MLNLRDLRTLILMLAGFFLLITGAPIVVEMIENYGRGDASTLVQIVLAPFYVVAMIFGIFGAIYFSILYPDMDFSSVEADFAQPHAIGWAVILIAIWATRHVNIAAIGGIILAQIMSFFVSRKRGDEFGANFDLSGSPEARSKEIKRAKLANELEKELAEQKKLEARIAARKRKT